MRLLVWLFVVPLAFGLMPAPGLAWAAEEMAVPAGDGLPADRESPEGGDPVGPEDGDPIAPAEEALAEEEPMAEQGDAGGEVQQAPANDAALSAQTASVEGPRVEADESMAAGQVATWDCVWLGSYPQTEVKPGDAAYASVQSASWVDDDAAVGGTRYRRVRRGDAIDGGYNWSYDGYGDDVEYRYFKYEPVKWRVLEVEGSRALVVADVALDCRQYNATNSDCVWETSSARSWLNGYGSAPYYGAGAQSGRTSLSFASVAFTTDELGEAVLNTLVHNVPSMYYGTDGGNDTTDKVFLLSESEVFDREAVVHGFVEGDATHDEARRCKVSDYGRAMGAWRDPETSQYTGNTWWWLRSPGEIWDGGRCLAAYVGEMGGTDCEGIHLSQFVTDLDNAVRPALNLDLASTLVFNAGTVSSKGVVVEVEPPADISGATIAPIEGRVYDGTPYEPTPEVTLGDTTLVNGTDYELSYENNVNAGTATVTATGKGNYARSASATFQITAIDLSGATVAPIGDQTFTGSAIEPEPTVTLGGRVLDPDTDYDVTYASNINVGTATATITGKGNYGGTKDVEFQITRKAVTVTADNKTRAYGVADPEFTATVNGLVGDDVLEYTFSRVKGEALGVYAITPSGNAEQGNYAVTYVNGKLTIVKGDIANAEVASIPDQTFTGSAIEPEPTVTLGSRVLVRGTDYDVTYADNVNCGTATATITGKDNYEGTKEITFEIVPKPVTVAADDKSKAYGAADPELTATVNGLVGDDALEYTLSRAKGEALGVYDITPSGDAEQGNYAVAYVPGKLTIAKGDITNAEVAHVEAQLRTGEAIKPEPTVMLGGRELVKDTDYELSYANNVEPGTATVTATGIGNYEGSVTAEFRIVAGNLSDATIAPIGSRGYDGTPYEPKPEVTLGGETLVEGTDFEFSYANNVNASKEGSPATLTVTGIGNYMGSATATFQITPADISDATIAPIGSRGYDGTPYEPKPEVTLGGETLVEGTDFEFSYANNVNASKEGSPATLTVTGIGNYMGTKSATFQIDPSSAFTVDSSAAQTYTGSALTPKPTVRLGSATLSEGTDYTLAYANNVNAGTATVTVTGKGNYTGSKSAAFKINPSSAFTVAAPAAQAYTGKALTPKPTVSLGSAVLGEGTDYALSYANNTNAGTATVTVTGKGNYTGSKSAAFKINPSSAFTVAAPAAQAYTGKALTPKPTVSLGSAVLGEGADYTLSWSNNVNAGTATVTVTGKANYTGSKSATFKINPAKVSPTVALSKASLVYDGKAQRPAVTVRVGSAMLAASSYTVAWPQDTKSVGTKTVTVTLRGNYTGTGSASYTIVPKGTKVSKLTPAKKALTVKWKKQATQTTGYQVQYATGKGFKKGAKTVTVPGAKKTGKKIAKLTSKKTYYVRVRTYKKVGGKTYYSAWSAAKRVKTK